MSELLRKKLEVLANVAIISVSLIIGYILVKDKILNRPTANNNLATSNTNNRPKIGEKVQIQNVDWGKNGQTLLVVLSKGCKFCSESAGFYQRLVKESADKTNQHVIAVFPQDVETGKNYLKELGISADVIQTPLDSISVRGTPTLILVDGKGMVKESWIGRLPVQKEEEVLAHLR